MFIIPINLLYFFILHNFLEKKFIDNTSLKTPQKFFLAKLKINFNFKILIYQRFFKLVMNFLNIFKIHEYPHLSEIILDFEKFKFSMLGEK